MRIENNSAPLEHLGSKIRRVRMDLGLGQERLAIESNVDQSGLSKLERGKDRRMSREALGRIASVLGLTYDQLLEGTGFAPEGASQTGSDRAKERR
jgi:transcriptional regulator with XRE-family HTH domain